MLDAFNVALAKLKKTGFFHIFGSSVINKIIAFLSGVIIVRIVSKAGYGTYTYANNIYNFFAIASGLGMASATLQLGSEKADEENQRGVFLYGYKTGLKINTSLGLMMLAAAVLIDFPISEAKPMLAAFCLLPLFSFALEQKQVFLRVMLRNREYSYGNTFYAFFLFLFSVGFALLFGAYGLILANYLATAAAFLFITKKFKVYSPLKKVSIEKKTKKSMWEIGIISAANNGLSSLMYLLDIFVIGLILPSETVIASYKVATSIPSALMFIPASILTYVYPYFSRNKDNREWSLSNYKKLTVVSGIVNFAIALVMILLSGFLVPMLFGKQYSDSVSCFIILCISFAISGTFRMIGGNLLVTQRKLKFNLFVAGASSAFNTVMNVILILRWGSIGAAVATLLTAILTSILNVGYLLHVYRSLPAQ